MLRCSLATAEQEPIAVTSIPAGTEEESFKLFYYERILNKMEEKVNITVCFITR